MGRLVIGSRRATDGAPPRTAPRGATAPHGATGAPGTVTIGARRTAPARGATGAARGAATIAPSLLHRADPAVRAHLRVLAFVAEEYGFDARIGSWADAAALGDKIQRSRLVRLDRGLPVPGLMPRLYREMMAMTMDQLEAIHAYHARIIEIQDEEDKRARRRKGPKPAPRPRRKPMPKFPKRSEAKTMKSVRAAIQAMKLLEAEWWSVRELKNGQARLWWR